MSLARDHKVERSKTGNTYICVKTGLCFSRRHHSLCTSEKYGLRSSVWPQGEHLKSRTHVFFLREETTFSIIRVINNRE